DRPGAGFQGLWGFGGFCYPGGTQPGVSSGGPAGERAGVWPSPCAARAGVAPSATPSWTALGRSSSSLGERPALITPSSRSTVFFGGTPSAASVAATRNVSAAS